MRSSTVKHGLFFLLLAGAALGKPHPPRPTPARRVPPAAKLPQHTFALGAEHFLLDGKPLQMISGELHYPRIPREAWRSRLKMAKAMGLNTIGTYVFWNVHEPQPGKYDFTGKRFKL